MNSHENLIRIVLLSLLFYAVLSFLSSGHKLKEAQNIETELAAEFEALEADRLQMRQRLESKMSDEELAQLARQRLGLVLPGEKIFYFTTDREA